MTIDDFAYEYDSLTRTRQLEGIDKLFKIIIGDIGAHRELIDEILEVFVAAEAEDYFGTEGANI